MAVRNIDITLPGANNWEHTVAVGKSFKATASVVPSTATVKTLNWYAVDEEGNPSDVVSVKNGTVKALKAGEALVIVESTDGNYAINSFKVVVTEKPAAKVVINNGEKTAVITRHHDGYVEFTPTFTVLGADSTTDGVSQDVKITVAGTNGKYVEKWQDGDGQWYFSVNRAGKYTVKATTTDGTNKSATITVDVQQHVIDMQPTAPKGVTVVDESTWAVNVGTAFTPTAVYNFGEKLLAPTAAAKKFTVSLDPDTAAHSPYETGVALEDCITISGTKITAKVRGVYRLLFTPVSACEECAAETKAITLKVLYKNSTDLTNVTVRTNKGVIDEDNTLYLRTGVQAQLTAMINGVKANTKKVELYWKATDVRTGATQYGILDSYTGKLNLTGVEPGTELEIKCFAYDIYDKYNDNSDRPATIRVVVTEKLTKDDIGLVEVLDSDNMVPVTEQSYTLSYGDIYAVVSRLDGKFTFKSSNAKIVSIVEGYDLAGFETLLRPTGTGTATITVTANDGSGVKNTFKVKVVAEEVPVKAVVPSAKAFTISTGNTFAFGYSLTPAKAGMTVSNPVVKWTVSDPSLMAFVDPSTGETTETAQTYGMEDTVYLQALGTRTGKVTVTGTAMDGSKKTVKVTVNICAGNSTDLLSYFDLSTPANTPNDGVDGQAVLTWGKSMQLKATYTPRKAKNVTLIWDVVGIDVETGEEILNPAGITVKNGKVTVAKATASLTPFTGVIRVTARTAQQYYDGSEYYSFERSQEILVKAPLTSVKLTAPATLYPGETAQIVPQLGLAAGATAEDYPLLWTVNDAKLAEIDSEGNLTIKDTAPIGKSVKVTAQTLDGTGKKATVTVKIANS